MQPEQNPNIAPIPSPEAGLASETIPTPTPVPAEREPAAAPSLPVTPASKGILPADLAATIVPATSSAPMSASTAPATADDVDVIEKEWVDEANKINKQTAGNPYEQEEAVESLQIDYLKKRYGHDVKKTENS